MEIEMSCRNCRHLLVNYIKFFINKHKKSTMMKCPIVKLEENKCLLSLKKEFYEAEVVVATAHKFTNTCSVLIDSFDSSTIDIYFENKNPLIPQDLNTVAQEFCNELLEQQLRSTLEKKFGNLRDLIVQHAFAPILKLRTDSTK